MQDLLLWEFQPNIQNIVRQVYFWSGFAIWIGLAARFLFPAKGTNGAWLTLCVGFIGSCLGPITTKAIFKVENFNPVGPAGFVAATFVAFATLVLFWIVSFLATPNAADDDEETKKEAAEREREISARVVQYELDRARERDYSNDRRRRSSWR